MSIADKVSNIGLLQRATLHATVIRACRGCGAPGFYHDVSGVNVGCYDPARKGQPVGTTCPNCGAAREAIEDKGEIWRRDVTVWSVLFDRIKGLFKRSQPA